jgi:hypothetical protein
MAKKQVLGFKPAPRLEQVDDEHSERMQDWKHRAPMIPGRMEFRKGHLTRDAEFTLVEPASPV